MSNLVIHQFSLGTWDNFLYFIGDKNTREVFVVDPAWGSDKIVAEAEKNNFIIKGALCTHSHADHVNSVHSLLKTHDIPVYMLDKEVEFTTWRCENLNKIKAGQILKVGNVEITTMHTPGHTPGSSCYHVEDRIVTGDTLFVNGCGRCDFVGGSPEVMYETLKGLTRNLAPNTIVYPGHNYGKTVTSTIADEKNGNPFMQFDTLDGFINHRMAGKTRNTPALIPKEES